MSLQRSITKIATCLLMYKKSCANKKYWVRPILLEREERGEYNSIVQNMRISDHQGFFMLFRMNPERFDDLLSKVGPIIQRKDTNFRKSIPPSVQLALTLRYLAHGGEQQICALAYRVGNSTIHYILNRVSDALWEVLSKEYLKVPNEDDFLNLSKKFDMICNFPHCLGAVDGKHIAIQQPHNSGSLFYNYKATNSIIFLATCDAEYRFTMVDIGAPGICSDGGVFSNSAFGKLIEQQQLKVPSNSSLPGMDIAVPYCFVGDEAFPLLPNLLRPYPGKNLSIEQAVFNYRLSRARRYIENSFGILSARWRIFRNTIQANPENVIKFVKATVCLHNYLRTLDIKCQEEDGVYCTSSYVDLENLDGTIQEGQWRNDLDTTAMIDISSCQSRNSTTYAKMIRQHYLSYFMTEHGKLPWQMEVIRRGYNS